MEQLRNVSLVVNGKKIINLSVMIAGRKKINIQIKRVLLIKFR